MPAERTAMRQVRDVLRLKTAGVAINEIARRVGVASSTVRLTLKRLAAAGLGWPLPPEMTDTALEEQLFTAVGKKQGHRGLAEPDWAAVHRELKRKHVTLQILWDEYIERHPEGYRYSRFCELYRAWAARLSVTMRQSHAGGDRRFVDYVGDTVPVIVDRLTGKTRPAQIFVAVLGASNFTYAEASWTQALGDWIGAHTRAFEAIGGVPNLLVPDNTKVAVIKACLYEPQVNRTYAEMAAHYGTAVLPARPRRPRDKATASYSTSFGDLRGDGNEPGRARRFSAAALEDGLVGRQLPEATLQLVLVELRDQSLAAPLLDGGPGDAEACSDLAGGQHAEAAQPLIRAGQLVGGSTQRLLF